MRGEGHTRTGPTDLVHTERDGLTCTLCGEPPVTATPAGPICEEHTAQLAEHHDGTPDRCRVCGRDLGAGYLCDDCDTVEGWP